MSTTRYKKYTTFDSVLYKQLMHKLVDLEIELHEYLDYMIKEDLGIVDDQVMKIRELKRLVTPST